MAQPRAFVIPFLLAFALSGCGGSGAATSPAPAPTPAPTPGTTVKIAFLHHSTGGAIWAGGVPECFTAYNAAHGTRYEISAYDYPDTGGGYPWQNNPWDYWNLWVAHTGSGQDRGEYNLDQIAANFDVIVFKHCFPVSAVGPDSDCSPASVASPIKTLANYQLQYQALKARMLQFPTKKFIVWTGAALREADTTLAQAQRARQFFDWVKGVWDVKGDNIFVWDFESLECAGSADGGIYMNDANASGTDSHPNAAFSGAVAPLFAQRVVDVIEGRGDSGSLTGR